jgi:lysyl-tRNA synthetase class 2
VAPLHPLNGLPWRQRPAWARAGAGSPCLAELAPDGPETTVLGRVVARPGGGVGLADASGEIALGGPVPPAGVHAWVTGRVQDQVLEVLRFQVAPGPVGRAMPAERVRLLPRIDHLRTAARCRTVIRSFFDSQGYLEVETPALAPSPGLELHLRALAAGPGYLNTSPEYQMKRLLAAGLHRIYQLGHAFRDEERGDHHLREFDLLEWYRVGADLPDLMRETEALVVEVARAAAGTDRLILAEGAALDLAPPWERLTVAEAFRQHAGVETDGTEPGATLAARARDAGWPLPADVTDWDEAWSRLFVTAVEPRLGRGRPTILHDYPARQAALARLQADDPRFAERFEVFAGGLELANAFGELADPVEQRQRLLADQAARAAAGLAVYPVDERFVDALVDGLPPCSGIALGVDRLVMLVTGAARIDEVVPFATEEL